MRAKTRGAWLWGPPLAWMAVIFAASSISDIPEPPGGFTAPVGHFAEYAVLSLLLVRALTGNRWADVTWRVALVSVLVSTAYGISDEWHQSFVPGREPDLLDVLIDATGASTAAGAAWAWGIIKRFWHPREDLDGVHQPSARA
jgi:hypothetical protein